MVGLDHSGGGLVGFHQGGGVVKRLHHYGRVVEGLDHRGGGVGEQLGGGGGGSGEGRGGEAQQRNLDTGILSIIYTFHNYIVCPTLELIVVCGV